MTDMSGMVSVIQTQNQILTALLSAFRGGLVVQTAPSLVYTFAALPATAASWTYAICSNGRKPGEGGGAGTGVPVFYNPGTGTWFSFCSGAVVTA